MLLCVFFVGWVWCVDDVEVIWFVCVGVVDFCCEVLFLDCKFMM